MDGNEHTYSVFADFRRLVHTGTDLATAIAHGRRAYAGGVQTVVVFDDATGDRTEIDPRADSGEAERLAPKRVGPGRPKLGVVSREVSLLPRHWDWLGAQPGGASVALRRLVDEARKKNAHVDLARTATDAAFKFMSVVGGDLPQFEEASRALYAGRFADVRSLTSSWPEDLRVHLGRLVDRAERLR